MVNILSMEKPEELLNRIFPVVSYTQTYALWFVDAGHFVKVGSVVSCTDDMCPNNGRFSFVPTPATAAVCSNTVSLGKTTMFGLQATTG